MVEKEREELTFIAQKLWEYKFAASREDRARMVEIEPFIPRRYFDDIDEALAVLGIITKYDILDCIGIEEDKEKVKWFIATHKNLD